MDVAGIGLIALAGACMFGVVVVAALVLVIKGAVQRAASRAVDSAASLGHGLAQQASGAVMRVGERELVKGWDTFKKTINHEMLTSSPEKMDNAVVKLAQTHGGELTCGNVMAELGVEERLARDTFERLVDQEVCVHEERGEGDLWIFPAFKAKRDVKVCDYCDSIFEPDEAGSECLACGAQLRTATTI